MATDMKILEQACKNVKIQGWWTSLQGCPIFFDGAFGKIIDEYWRMKHIDIQRTNSPLIEIRNHIPFDAYDMRTAPHIFVDGVQKS